MAVTANFSTLIGDVARRLLGEPNGKLSTRRTLRFGKRGAFAVYTDGKHRGFWRDFATGERGGVVDLVVRERGGSRAEAFLWLQSERLVDADKQAKVPPTPADEPQQHATLSDWGRRLWQSCRPITANDPAGRYLRGRSCAPPHPNGDLRWHPVLKHPSGHSGPALVGLITDARGALLPPLNLHRTWIVPDGSGCKADLERPRLLLKGHSKAGGVIRLWPDDLMTYGLGLAEGLETALTLARVFTPVWSTIDAGNLGSFPVLAGIDAVTACVDHDPAGLRAFDALAERWTAAGREVRRLLTPDPRTNDLNDWSRAA
jgi:putative DNA primase/helicase